MTDLVPLIAFLVCVGFHVVVLLLTRGSRGLSLTSAQAGALRASSVALVVLPFVCFAVIAGEPDVWDFYRSVWFVPLIVGVALIGWLWRATTLPARDGSTPARDDARVH
ncbi:MAG: hypothetical protein L0G22_02000 [Propionibacteriaceae bacterium]|nr:hypothetical protein [Propionibacteriaceae bacterium]